MNTTGNSKYIGYYRVSTARQGRSGLGLEAQRQAVQTHLRGEKPIREFTEVESGRRSDRPKLAEALAACRVHKAALVIAKLDRLARNVAFVSNLMDAGVEFEAVSCGRASPPQHHDRQRGGMVGRTGEDVARQNFACQGQRSSLHLTSDVGAI